MNHRHRDANHLIYYAHGKEVVGGTGYRVYNRGWNSSTFNQNLVTVDGQEQKGNYWLYWTESPYAPGQPRREVRQSTFFESDENYHNNLLLWEPGYGDDKEVQVVEVDAADAYRGLVGRYQRMLAMVHTEGDDTYLIDFFRLQGGRRYDWHLHGGHTAYTLVPKLIMTPTPGSIGAGKWQNINYEGITNLSRAMVDDTWEAELNYDGVTERILMAGAVGTNVYQGEGLTSPPVDDKNSTARQGYLVARREVAESEIVN